MLGAFLTFPGLRLAQTHRDALTMSEDRPMLQLSGVQMDGRLESLRKRRGDSGYPGLILLPPRFLLHISFLSPLFILWLWTKPIARDLLRQAPFGEMPFSLCVWGRAGREGSWGPFCVFQSLRLREELLGSCASWGKNLRLGEALLAPSPSPHRLSDSAFDSMRLWVLVALCLLRLAVTRPHLQAYLCLAKSRVEQLRREAGRIEAREIQRRVRLPIEEGNWGAEWGFWSLCSRVSLSPEVICHCFLPTRWYGSTAM